MGRSALEKLRAAALNLSEADRAALARDLVASLDGPRESDVEPAWDAELRRRLGQVEAGAAELIDREEFRRRLRAHSGEN